MGQEVGVLSRKVINGCIFTKGLMERNVEQGWEQLDRGGVGGICEGAGGGPCGLLHSLQTDLLGRSTSRCFRLDPATWGTACTLLDPDGPRHIHQSPSLSCTPWDQLTARSDASRGSFLLLNKVPTPGASPPPPHRVILGPRGRHDSAQVSSHGQGSSALPFSSPIAHRVQTPAVSPPTLITHPVNSYGALGATEVFSSTTWLYGYWCPFYVFCWSLRACVAPPPGHPRA